jgi:hypothetical protein
LKQDDCPNGDLSPSYYDNSCETSPEPKKMIEEVPEQPIPERPLPSSEPSLSEHAAPSLPEIKDDDAYGQQYFQTPLTLPKT